MASDIISYTWHAKPLGEPRFWRPRGSRGVDAAHPRNDRGNGLRDGLVRGHGQAVSRQRTVPDHVHGLSATAIANSPRARPHQVSEIGRSLALRWLVIGPATDLDSSRSVHGWKHDLILCLDSHCPHRGRDISPLLPANSHAATTRCPQGIRQGPQPGRCNVRL
jgi:hypothetical protein